MKNYAILLIFVILINITLGYSIPDKVCDGTNNGLRVPSISDAHYHQLRERYTNCTYVEGNLEITWLSSASGFDSSFLENIREVTGYVLISHFDAIEVVLPRLKVIRGKTLFKLHNGRRELALFVTMSKLNRLEMPALREISNGDVGMYNNYNLCHVKTINWDEIISGFGCKYSFVYNFTTPERVCSECDRSCEQGCWGDGPENCQRFSKTNCSPQCYPSRCFSPNPCDCCHANCIGGCTGPKATDCIACRYAKNNDECVSTCPQGKSFFAGNCEAVKSADGICTVHDNSSSLNSEDIEKYRGCTTIQGSLHIHKESFLGYKKIYSNFTLGPRFDPMHPDKLEVLSTVKTITGSLYVWAEHQDFKNLSYLRNLEIIGGIRPNELLYALYIESPSLTSLGLRSLKKIGSGSVFIKNNKNLCYASTLNWNAMVHSTDSKIDVSQNREENDCIANGLMCDDECSMQGCWGPGLDQCVSCKNVILDGICATSCNKSRVYTIGYHKCKTCPEEDHYFEVNTQRCGSCDPQCQGCHGPGPTNCTNCKNFKLFANAKDIKNQSTAFTCIEKCPIDHLTGLCFDMSSTNSTDIETNSGVFDDFIIMDTKAVNNYRPYHDESNGICKGSNSEKCNACKHVRNSLSEFLKSFPKYHRVRSD